jgi:hypothetical protein
MPVFQDTYFLNAQRAAMSIATKKNNSELLYFKWEYAFLCNMGL